MELLSPAHPPVPPGVNLSGFSPPTRFRHGFDRKSATVASQPPEIVEAEGNKIYVAVGKSLEKNVALLRWAFRHFSGVEICILHVYQPSLFIPTLLGKLPASQASHEVVSSFRMEEREQMGKLLSNYLSLCRQAKVEASTIVTEASQIEVGILDLINTHGVTKLVMGAVPENCMKVRRSSRKASYAAKNAPHFCEIWFVNKGKHLWTKEAFEGSTFVGLPKQPKTECTPLGSVICDGVIDEVQTDDAIHCTTLLHSSSNGLDPHCSHALSSSSSTSSSSGSWSSAEQRVSSNFVIKDDEESLVSQLTGIRVEAEVSKAKSSQELLDLKYKAFEARAMEAKSKVKALESTLANEIELRKEAEDALKITIQEQKQLLDEREKATRELQKSMRSISFLDSRAQEANRRREEVAGELKLVQASIAALHHEKQKIRWQKMEATRWLDSWKTRRRGGIENYERSNGFDEGLVKFIEFSLADLRAATCDFSKSFTIGHSGYGSLCKGELLGQTVAIKRLHAQNIQRQLEFVQEVQVLGRLRHPHLVTLLGTCPEAWSLVYEYLPNGSLRDHLHQRSNSGLLTWKIRARIISEISSALLYLHSHGPVDTVHGGLKPENILLDHNASCKLSDYGIFRVVPKDMLRCPSFRRCTEPKGAFSYTDPEFHRTGHLTKKSDIYSFGLIVLQLLTSRTPAGLVAEVSHAVSCGKTGSILDVSAGEWPNYVAKRLVELGLQCCELNGRDRPDLTPRLVKELEQLHTIEERTPPPLFLCPILKEIMQDPRVAADGFTYEGEALVGWLASDRDTSPMTNLKLDHLELTPNNALRAAIQDWLCRS